MAILKREIQLIELPQCFQEAVTAARRLGGQYLWIDSLCIVQDSPHDWAIESEQMLHVYSNGICNLAASNQSKSNRGLFCNRDAAMGAPITVDSFWSHGGRAEKWALYPNFANLFTKYGPLYKRAWVTQEQQLSPRTIHMAPFPVWECREATLTELFPSAEAFDPSKSQYISTKFSLSEDKDTLLKNWLGLTSSYSQCELTNDGDTLIALCGIAKAFSQVFRCRYFAGIWEDYLLEGLLWRAAEQIHETAGQGKIRRCKEYVAPSWSWTSVKGISLPFSGTIDLPLVVVLKVETQPRNGDPFGQVCGGCLTLNGVLFEFPRISEMLLHHRNFLQKPSYKGHALAFDDCGIDDYGCLDSWFLPLAVASEEARYADLTIWGIILQKTTGLSEAVAYTRVGHAVVSRDGDIAGSGWLIPDWIPQPWEKHRYQKIEIV
ncbi:hypothetical protein CDV31_001625 [Fusarium ambrosium]|uniref:Heterokaryon incompatibility domain-containing protein n=1 Tax=Fusarium ambrosium TaxID=131363 RepID=A0A428UYU3_9HYPO|nr:hypothetical protein CDV31_001625 [Fusarium ambrosium]